LNNINEYNQYENLYQLPHNIVTYLFQNDDIWKLLYYSQIDALKQPPLTNQQKRNLIYNGQINSENYRCFFMPFTDDSFDKQHAQIRVYPVTIMPTNRILGDVSFAIEILSHVKINTLDNYSTRILYLLQQIIKTLNGKDIGSVGNIAFDRKGSGYDSARLNIYNNKNYLGYTLIMSTHISS
jgi:hypothetical protein